MIFIDCKK